jgi:hypothetical protein
MESAAEEKKTEGGQAITEKHKPAGLTSLFIFVISLRR